METHPPVIPNGFAPPGPSPTQQSWGAFISIVVIVLMIVVGAFYAWGKRVAEEHQYPVQSASIPVSQ